ncbi:MAG: hypothetical protein U0K68_08110 [Agathobacter sp.]|nr:hypothetical protein [Agathobacter sp.]
MTIYNDYRCMVNRTYRIIANLVLPISLGVLSSAITLYTQSEKYYLFIFLMFLVNIDADYFGIGCICKKDSFGMEYVKTSFRARTVIKHTFLLDMCFGVLRNLLFYLTCLVYMVDRSSNISILVVTFLLINIFYILSLNITRYFDSFLIMQFVAMILEAIFIACMIGLYVLNLGKWGTVCLLCILLIASFIVTYYHMILKLNASYKDN